MIDPQSILTAIKDYGAAVISTVSVGGIAAATAAVIKVKKAIDDVKNNTKAALAKKDEALAASNSKVDEVLAQNKALLSKIDNLTSDVYKLESEVRSDVKGNRKN